MTTALSPRTGRSQSTGSGRSRQRPPFSPAKRAVFVSVVLLFGWLLIEAAVLGWLLYDGFRIDRGVKTEFVNEMPNNLAAHPRHVWRYIPGTHYTYQDTRDKYPFQVQINSEGFRDEEPAERKARFRFVALGDSFTFGWMVQQRDRWDEVLAGMISAAPGRSAASINRGMWMSTFDQHAVVLEENLPRDCNAVIHLIYPSHLQTINRHVVKTRNGKIDSIYDPLLHLKGTALYFGAAGEKLVQKHLSFPFTACLFRFHRNARLLAAQVKHDHTVPEMTDEQIYQKASQPVFEHAYDLARRSFGQIAAFCRERNIPYYVAIIPRDRQLSAEEWNGTEPVAEILSASVPQDRLRRIIQESGANGVIDLLPLMRENYNPDLYHHHDTHWKPAGHRAAAAAILKRLQADGVVLN